MIKSSIAILVAAVSVVTFFLVVESAPLSPVKRSTPGKSGQTIALVPGSVCLMLPPEESGDIAKSEDCAKAFCQHPNESTPGAKPLPEGFIQSANFLKNETAGWIQVTGRMDRTSYQLKDTDEGGQYDTRAPLGASCADYSSFVQIMEPANNIYCLRCCKSKHDCPVNRSTHGCNEVLGGQYS